MTSPDTDPMPPDPPGPRRLTRSSADQVLGGVAGGLGRYFSVDPILFRIGFAVITLAGGAGLLAYVALWLLVPDDEGRTVQRPDGTRMAVILGGGLALLLLIGLLPGPGVVVFPGFLGLLILAGLVIAIAGADRGGDARTRLLRALLVALAVMAAVFVGVCAAIGTAFGGGAVVAGIVIALGIALIAGAFGRGRRWLLVPALVVAAPAAFVQAADVRLDGGVGEREYRPTTVDDLRDVYRLGAGEMTIDLRDVDFPEGHTVLRVQAGVGSTEIVVPEGVCVSSRVRIGAGVADVFRRQNSGIGVDWSQVPRNSAGAPSLFVDLDQELGAVLVRRPFGAGWDRDRDGGPFGWDDEDETGPVEQEACSA